jgi:Fur family ferric uptake transcriptional regulator
MGIGRTAGQGLDDTGAVRRGRQSPHWDALVAVLGEHTSFRSVAQLYDDLRERGHRVGLVTVYRHLEAMSRRGAVAMVAGSRGEARYRLRSGTTDHCPLVCGHCQRVVDVNSLEVTRWAQVTAAEHGFIDIQVHAMATGVCPRCQPVPHGERPENPHTPTHS